MRGGDFAAALRLLAVDTSPQGLPAAHAESLYLAAVCHRYQRSFDLAALCLQELLRREPGHGRALQERGHLSRDRGDEDAALRAYAQASQINPALDASLRGQLAILERRGERAAAQQVAARLARLEGLPRPLRAVTDLLSRGMLLRAETLCRRFLQQAPQHVEGMRLLAEIAIGFGALEEAEFLLESAATFEPGNIPARIDHVRVLGRRQKFAAARTAASRLLEEHPHNVQLESLHAVECLQAGDYAAALAGFERVLQQLPGDPTTLTSRGHALKTCGDTAAAVASYREALQRRPAHGEAWYALANLKTYRFEPADVGAMRALLASDTLMLMDRVHIAFALGKALEDAGEYAESFAHYAEGNRLKRAGSRYDSAALGRELAAQRQVCTANLLAQAATRGCPAPDPIFIVGMPRAGSTLLEQILSSHSQIDGTQELPNVLAMSQQLRRRQIGEERPGYPQLLPLLDAQTLRALGEQFIEETRLHRAGAPRFIDKMPNNFRHLGLIHLILPNARIIDARREPMACCFSNFKQLFAEGQEFSYDLADLGHYYREYLTLMAHWEQVIPADRLLRVQHEDVLNDLEGQVRRMLAFLGLPFEEACLRYWETERAVRTPSSEQVRRPIFRSAMEQWHNYAPWLGALQQALDPASGIREH